MSREGLNINGQDRKPSFLSTVEAVSETEPCKTIDIQEMKLLIIKSGKHDGLKQKKLFFHDPRR